MTHLHHAPPLERLDLPAGDRLHRAAWIAGGIGALGLLASFALAAADSRQFAFSWLAAFLFALSLALGSLFFVLVHFAANAGWGVAVRRIAENVMCALPLLALLALPVLASLDALFPWAHPDAPGTHGLGGKRAFLNPGFFHVRAAAYFVCWSVLAVVFARSSRRQDRSGDPEITRRLFRFSGPSLGLFAVTVTFAAFDWIMSLDPLWYSTIFGVYFFAGSLVGALALLVVLVAALDAGGHFGGAISVEHFHDLGKLLFAFTVFWAYIGFSQFFLIWYANLPEETGWYLRRLEGNWRSVTLFLALGHFVVPFFFLMSRHIKRRRPLLVAGAVWMLAMHMLDLHWLVLPNLHPHGAHPGLLDLTTLVAVVGLFLAGTLWITGRGPLVPVRDPRLSESLHLTG